MNDLEITFKKIIELAAQPDTNIYGTGLWKKCHDLADAQFLPARRFFIKELDDSRWDWREASVSLLGFHYKLGSKILEKIRFMLIHDPESGVRIACAGVLGHQSKFPDRALFAALINDKEINVRIMAFDALLELGGVSKETQLKELKNMRTGKKKASLAVLRRIYAEENLISTLELVEKL